MGDSIKNAVNWWAVVHTLVVLGQLSIFVVGTVTFVLYRPSSRADSDSDIPSVDRFEDDFTKNSTLPWVSSAVGALTTFLNVILFIVLWKNYQMARRQQRTSCDIAFRNAVMGSSVLTTLVSTADVILAVKAGLSGKSAICAAAIVGCVFSILTVCADQFKLRRFYGEQKKHSYIIELGGSNQSMPAPPSYDAAIGAQK